MLLFKWKTGLLWISTFPTICQLSLDFMTIQVVGLAMGSAKWLLHLTRPTIWALDNLYTYFIDEMCLVKYEVIFIFDSKC